MARHTYLKDSMAGTKLGLLHLDYKTTWKQGANPVYMCTCDCGNKVLMSITTIKRCKSCGCDKPNRSSYITIKGDAILKDMTFDTKGEI